MVTVARVAGENFELDPAGVERAVAGIDPEPIREHYVVIGRRRYPPSRCSPPVTGLDCGDFTTHQARSILRRLGSHSQIFPFVELPQAPGGWPRPVLDVSWETWLRS